MTHLNYLDGTRATAAMYVLMHHILMQVEYEESMYFYLLNSLFQYGRFAVDVFIVLSGFCLMIPLVKGDHLNMPANFFKRRAIRILPTYYIALAFSLFLIYTLIGKKTGSHWDASIPVTTWDIFTHLILIQDLFGETAYKINHTFWSISVECRIYLLFPILIKSCQKFGITVVTILSLFVSFILWHGYAHIGLNPYTMSPHYLSLFMFGMLACYISFTENKLYANLKNRYLDRITWILIIFILNLVVVIPNVFPTLTFSTLTADYMVGACAATLLLAMSAGKLKTLAKVLSWYPLVFIGTFAYSIYLIHAPVLQVIAQYFVLPFSQSQESTLFLMITLGTLINLVLAYLFFIVAEKPFMKKKSSLKLLTNQTLA